MKKETNWRTRKYRWEPKQTARSLIEEQNRLAFLKFQIEREGGDPESDPEVLQQRRQIEELREGGQPPGRRPL